MSILEKTQTIREMVIDNITTNGNTVPEDPDKLATLLEVMRDADRTELTLKRICSDNQNAESDRELALALVNVTKQRQGANPFLVDITPNSERIDPRSIIDVQAVPVPKLVDGNMDIGTSTETYDDFIVRTEGADT